MPYHVTSYINNLGGGHTHAHTLTHLPTSWTKALLRNQAQPVRLVL